MTLEESKQLEVKIANNILNNMNMALQQHLLMKLEVQIKMEPKSHLHQIMIFL